MRNGGPTLLLLVASLSGCATSVRDRSWLDQQLNARLGAGTQRGGDAALPPGVALDDGIDSAEAVALALWRSPALRAELTRVDTARATLDEASRPANPQLSLMGPFGPVNAIATLVAPLESLWQLPRRSEAAALDADAVAEAVLMGALDLARDVTLLHLELARTAEVLDARRALAEHAVALARIAAVRARLGDIGALDAQLLEAEARAAADAADRAETDVALARARLAAPLALDADAAAGLRATFAPEVDDLPELGSLLAIARRARPDARSAELAIYAAAARGGFERSRAVNVAALADAQWTPSGQAGLRVGARVDLPIFGGNPGGIGRAEAELDRARAQLEVVARTVALEVQTAHLRAQQATRSRARLEAELLPALDAALVLATDSEAAGDEAGLVTLEVRRRIGEARLRVAEVVAEQRRARCELERALGARLTRLDAVPAFVRPGETTRSDGPPDAAHEHTAQPEHTAGTERTRTEHTTNPEHTRSPEHTAHPEQTGTPQLAATNRASP